MCSNSNVWTIGNFMLLGKFSGLVNLTQYLLYLHNILKREKERQREREREREREKKERNNNGEKERGRERKR
jgi:hypothetical protein